MRHFILVFCLDLFHSMRNHLLLKTVFCSLFFVIHFYVRHKSCLKLHKYLAFNKLLALIGKFIAWSLVMNRKCTWHFILFSRKIAASLNLRKKYWQLLCTFKLKVIFSFKLKVTLKSYLVTYKLCINYTHLSLLSLPVVSLSLKITN